MRLIHLSILYFTLCFLSNITTANTGPENILEDLSETKNSRKLYLRPRILDERGIVDYRCTKYSSCYTQMIEPKSYTFEMDPKTKFVVTLDLKRVRGGLAVSYKSDTDSSQINREIKLVASNGQEKLIEVPTEKEWRIQITEEDLKSYSQFVFSCVNLSSPKIIATVSTNFEPKKIDDSPSVPSSSGAPSIVVIALSSVGGLIFLWSVVGVYRWIRNRREARNEPVMGTRRVLSVIYPVLASQNSVKEIKDPLTQENLNERFPETKFEDLKSFFPQSMCSICLDDLQKDKMCRQLYCGHIFHSRCVKLWLENQLYKGMASCPNCKRSVIEKNVEAKPNEN